MRNKNTICCTLNSALRSGHRASVMWDDWAMVSLDIYPDIRCDAEITTDLSLITKYLEWSPARLRGAAQLQRAPLGINRSEKTRDLSRILKSMLVQICRKNVFNLLHLMILLEDVYHIIDFLCLIIIESRGYAEETTLKLNYN